MKKTLSILIAVLMALSLVTIASAAPLYRGDLDRNGKILAKEARQILRMSAHLDPVPAQGSEDFRLADVDGDGRILAKDARLALRMSASLEAKIPLENGEAPVSDYAIEDLSGWQTTCIVRDADSGEHDFDLTLGKTPDNAERHRLAITTGRSEIAPAFSVAVILDTFSSPNESMYGTLSYRAEAVARLLNNYLLRVVIGADGYSAWLLCHTEPDTDEIARVELLGHGDSCELIGNTIMVYARNRSDGETDTAADVFDWVGNMLRCPVFTFFRVIGENVVMLCNHDLGEDDRPSNKVFVYPFELFEEQVLTEAEYKSIQYDIGDYEARFANQTGGALILTAQDGRSFECTVAELPGLFGDNLRATGKVRETSEGDAYSVTLPDSWEGKYTVLRDGGAMEFRHKATGTLLCRLYIEPMPDDIEEEWTGGNIGIPLCVLAAENTPHYITLFDPGEIYKNGPYLSEIRQMRTALYDSSLYHMQWNIDTDRADVEIRQFEFVAELSGDYVGTGSVSGHEYRFEIDGGIRCDLQTRLYDLTTGEEASGVFRMYWVQGVMLSGPGSILSDSYLFDHQDGTLVLRLATEDVTLSPAY